MVVMVDFPPVVVEVVQTQSVELLAVQAVAVEMVWFVFILGNQL
jgi:hypothetical protein